MPKTILFDLDGTLTDSGEGIINCAMLALETLGIPVPDRDAMRTFVGPPLHDTFKKIGVPEGNVDEAVKIFRSRYFTVGKFENFPYPGIPELLQKLKAEGHTLYIATSKPETLALEVTQHFKLAQYFDMICGATLDNSRVNKEDVITYLLEQCSGANNVIMVGDTQYDVIGAKAHGIDTIGVTWGYGSEESMIRAGAAAIVHSTEELHKLINA